MNTSAARCSPIKAVKAGEAVVNDNGTLTAGPAVLQPEEYSSRLVAVEAAAGLGILMAAAVLTASSPPTARLLARSAH